MNQSLRLPAEERAGAISRWIVAWLAVELAVSPAEIDTDASFDHFGVDSVRLVGMTGELQDWLHREVDPALAYDYPTIASLSAALAQAPEDRDE